MTESNVACTASVSWWSGEYEGDCELPEDHTGDHFDGMAWFNDDGDLVRWADDNGRTI